VTAALPRLRIDSVRAPDRDFETLRQQAMDLLAVTSSSWTDHNISDPGVTLTEATLWALADLHVRTQATAVRDWSFDAGMWRSFLDRHWAPPLPFDPAQLGQLADAIAGLPAAAVHAVRTAATRADAARTVLDAGVGAALAAACVRLLRMPLLLEVGLDGADAAAIGLWEDELEGLARRRERRERAAQVRDRAAELRAVIEGSATATVAETAIAGLLALDPDEARAALAVHPNPPTVRPERWETSVGRTKIWPPHPLQARTVEPVTAQDYARVARTVPGVARAWAVPEVLPGIGWDGRPVADRVARGGAVTLLVDAAPDVKIGTQAQQQSFLRFVLRRAIGPEVAAPYAELQHDLTRRVPRRTICDEVGAALLRRCPVTLRGVIYVPISARREDVLAGALARIADHLQRGRSESVEPAPAGDFPRDIDGPWPLPPPMPAGWRPGEAVRIPEIVQAITRAPEVLGVEDLAASVAGGSWYADELALDPDCVPVLADPQCLVVRLELREDCDGC